MELPVGLIKSASCKCAVYSVLGNLFKKINFISQLTKLLKIDYSWIYQIAEPGSPMEFIDANVY